MGWTDQIAISPATADLRRGDFDWRVSTARVAQSADFSPFADHDRVLVTLEGAGARLSHSFEESEEPDHVELPAWEPYEFPGDVPTRCELMDGPIQDFSVFVRKGIVSGQNRNSGNQRGRSRSTGNPWEELCFLFVAQGQL